MSAVNKEDAHFADQKTENGQNGKVRQRVQKGYYSEADVGKNFNGARKNDRSQTRKGEGASHHKKEHGNRNPEMYGQPHSKGERTGRRRGRHEEEAFRNGASDAQQKRKAAATEQAVKPKETEELAEQAVLQEEIQQAAVQAGVDGQPVVAEQVPVQDTASGSEPQPEPEQIEVIGVRFRQAGKIYYFDPTGFEIPPHSHVIVETARGIEYGFVILGKRKVAAEKVIQPLKPVIRVATEEDEARNRQNRDKEKEALKICKEKIAKHGLEMKLIDCEYTFDNNKVLFYFTADGRIDFRELVKDLASIFKTRIELRQIGVRDETKIRGGIGMCGRPLCCHTYLAEFAPVSIKMAKDQNLSLNPVKISGICGRLMCCLKNEEETYEWLNSKLPNEGDFVTTPDGLKGEVKTVNVLRQLVKVIVTLENDEKEVKEYQVRDLKFKPHRKRGEEKIQDAELRALEKLETLEKGSNSKL